MNKKNTEKIINDKLEKSTTTDSTIDNSNIQNFLEQLSSKSFNAETYNIEDILIDHNRKKLNKGLYNNLQQTNTNEINSKIIPDKIKNSDASLNELCSNNPITIKTYETKNNINVNNVDISSNRTELDHTITNYDNHFNGSDEEWETYLNNLEKSINQSKNSEKIDVNDILTQIPINIKPLDNDDPNWDKEVFELESFFNSINLPTTTIWVNEFGKIEDVSRFVNKELMVCKTRLAYNCTSRPYANLNELKKLKKYFEENT